MTCTPATVSPPQGMRGAVDDQQGDDGHLGGKLEGLRELHRRPHGGGELLGQRVATGQGIRIFKPV
jgi:hypothetical protein